MGNIFHKQTTRPMPPGASIVVKAGKRFARWDSKGKKFTAPITGTDDAPRIVTTSKAYSARFRDHTGRVVERSTGCRDRQAAEQMLSRWEREQEQIRAGILDAGQLETARTSAGSIEQPLDAYEQSLIARDVSEDYKANAKRGIRRLINDLGLVTLSDLRREKIEPWFANAIAKGMTARTRNYYRESIVLFAKWLQEAGRIREHDLGKLPNADRRIDPRRQRRALTEYELGRLFATARTRPLDDARTIRRGKRKGTRGGELQPQIVKQLDDLGRERVLIYRTFVYTGLRLDELRTLTVAQLVLTPGVELIILESKNEKNSNGSTIPLRADLAEDLRQWIGERNLSPTSLLFTVPTGLRRILDRDMKAAGIPKRDERGRTVDVHALRTTFGTMLSTTGTAPRTAQAAMRHSDIKLTMGSYTDPKLLEVREAMERLPSLNGSDIQTKTQVALHVALLSDLRGQIGAIAGKIERETNCETTDGGLDVTPCNVNEKAPVASCDNTGALIGLTGFEPATSWSRTNGHPEEKPTILGESCASPLTLHSTLHHLPESASGSPPDSAPNLAALLAQLAALPADQRAALAVLLATPTVPISPSSLPSKPPALDDRMPPGFEREEGGKG